MGILDWPKKKLDQMPEMRWKKRVLYSLLILGYLVGVFVGMIILMPLAWIFDKIYEQF
jgi:H+/gluconate symporter-like permease